MEVELPARAASPPAKERETPPPSPAAAASPAEDAPLLPGDGCVRRRAMRERFAHRSASFRWEVTRLTLTLLRYLGSILLLLKPSSEECCIRRTTKKQIGSVYTSWLNRVEAGRGIRHWWSMDHRGTIGDMVEDVSQGISFVCNNIARYGGDPERIYLVGQSAGAHIAACTLVNKAIKECGEGDTSNWSLGQLKAYFGISGGYNLLNLVDHFHRRGLYQSVFLSIMEGEESLRKFSPQVLVKDVAVRSAVSLLPHIILFHGTSDCSMPSAESEAFLDALQQRGAKADLFLYEGKTHTDLFLQDPLRGGKDKMMEEIVATIHKDDPSESTQDLAVPVARRLVPEFMLMLAGRVSPF